jgi:hypothetical protein
VAVLLGPGVVIAALLALSCGAESIDNPPDGGSPNGNPPTISGLAPQCVNGATQKCGVAIGACKPGVQHCVNEAWGDCATDERSEHAFIEPSSEVCDRTDNDCDGDIDEGCECAEGDEQECGTELGECSPGIQRCKNARWGRCEDASSTTPHVSPQSEECDGRDNDCDGDIDESCQCEDEDELDCGSDVGACAHGTQTCERGRWGNCEGDVGPEQEECDGTDNDCDGDIDEGCDCASDDIRDCGTTLGACEPGVQHCVNGKWGRCATDERSKSEYVAPESEECNGDDDDCDGEIDENCECTDGETLDCGSDVGACAFGIQTCTRGRWGACQGGITPGQEACDAHDNDCDGDIDEGCDCLDGDTTDCGSNLGECQQGTRICSEGHWGDCEGEVGPDPEACDGDDNDCDGDIDEGCDCLNGTQQDCGESLGACQIGTQRCEDGRWGQCEGDIVPEAEVCDSEDNDCDGDIDEGCECEPGATRRCSAGAGACSEGLQTCSRGSWDACVPLTEPSNELCDDVDNDCDGDVDEGFDLSEPCGIGGCPQSRICSEDGLSSECVDDSRLFAPERCDGVDNDCDGLLDRVSENGSVRSICECETRTLSIGSAVNASGSSNLCASTQCTADRARGLLVDGICWPACQIDTDPDGDGWGFENGRSCLMPNSPRGISAPACDGVPIGMAMSYCLDCSQAQLPFAMCQSLPQFDLRAFGRGEVWLKIDYTFTSNAAARVPVNLWFHGGAGRKRLPLVRIGDIPGRHQAVLRVEDSCFEPTTAFGTECPGSGEGCDHCGANEVCGAVVECGDYDLRQAWLQIAAEFCEFGIGNQAGAVTIHSVDTIEPNCGH